MNRIRMIASIPPWEHWNTERMRNEQADNPRSFQRGFQMRAFSDSERMFPSFESCFTPGVVVAGIFAAGIAAAVAAAKHGRK